MLKPSLSKLSSMPERTFAKTALIACLFVSACAQNPSRSISEKPPEPRPALDARNLACLTEAIYFEAGNKGEAGRRAVAHVILNRVASSGFPNTVCGVISEGQSRGNCQFVYRCDLDYTRFTYPDQRMRAKATATVVLDGQTDDPTGGALFFHAAYAKPGPWFLSLRRVGAFGGNVFYL